MALLWIDGFEQYGVVDDLKDTYAMSVPTFTTLVTGRNTSAGNNQGVQLAFTSATLARNIGESTPTVVAGFAFLAEDALAAADIFRLYNDATEMLTLRVTAGGEIALDRHGERSKNCH